MSAEFYRKYKRHFDAFYKARQADVQVGATHETHTCEAFIALLQHIAKDRGWQLIRERALPNGRRPDVTFEQNAIPRGYYEAKDSSDDLDREIARKFEQGYPKFNILFEDTRQAVLYQNNTRIDPVSLAPENALGLARLLQTFFEYSAPDIERYDDALARFRDNVTALASSLRNVIASAHERQPAFQAAYQRFHQLCQTAIDPAIRPEQIDEMLIQHLMTERLIRNIFNNPDFSRRNVIAAAIEEVIAALTSPAFSRDEYLRELNAYYQAIEAAAVGLDFTTKQRVLNEVYERFFQGYSTRVADTHGIVYTPQEIVAFMCQSVIDILRDDFGKTLADPEVVIVDPCTGTGNFIVQLLRRANLPPPDLRNLYRERLFANEVLLMPYYVAALNIEHTFYELFGSYEPFEGLCFVDTLEIAERKQLSFLTERNTERVRRQKEAPITVIIGNPPYNAWQKRENDNNRNRRYPILDARIRETYAADSRATNKNSLYDPYVRFFRWAADRLEGRDGIVAFVSNNSFIDGYAFDGMRKHLLQDFTRIYHLDLGGNSRKAQRGEKISNVFDIRVGVGITIAVSRRAHTERHIFYCAVPEEGKKQKKLEWLAQHTPIPLPLSPQAGKGESEIADATSPALLGQAADATSPALLGQAADATSPALLAGRGSGGGVWRTPPELWHKLKHFAREMRRNPTPAEEHLWQHLRRAQRHGVKFRRQHTIGQFVVDFYAHEAHLIVEVDGEIHERTQEYDALRTQVLESMGFRVLRFTNDEVFNQTVSVLKRIDEALTPIPRPLSPQAGKGETEIADATSPALLGQAADATSPALLAGRGSGGGVWHTPPELGKEETKAAEALTPIPHPLSPQAGKGETEIADATSPALLGQAADATSPALLAGRGSGGGVWQSITPNAQHNWLQVAELDAFQTFLPMGSKDAKTGMQGAPQTIFDTYSGGVKTNRDDVVYDFRRSALIARVKQFIHDYNSEVNRYKQALEDKESAADDINIDDSLDYTHLKWDSTLKMHLQRQRKTKFDATKVRQSLYRPFCKQWLYFDRLLINSIHRQHYFFPTPETEAENRVICVSDIAYRAPRLSALMANCMADLHLCASVDSHQCFPFYTYAQDGTDRRENITDWALTQFRAHYGDQNISKWDIFYYIYAVLHQPEYRERFAELLKKELPRIPLAPDFWAYAQAGRQLGDLHVNYESAPEYPLREVWALGKPMSYRVEDAMKLRSSSAPGKYVLEVNSSLRLEGIPSEALEYKLGNRSALEWLVEQYRVKGGRDPNGYGDEQYIVRLVKRVVHVSLETLRIVRELPNLF
jgi:very-short-patch-repair endonuclease